MISSFQIRSLWEAVLETWKIFPRESVRHAAKSSPSASQPKSAGETAASKTASERMNSSRSGLLFQTGFPPLTKVSRAISWLTFNQLVQFEDCFPALAKSTRRTVMPLVVSVSRKSQQSSVFPEVTVPFSNTSIERDISVSPAPERTLSYARRIGP